MEDYLVLFRDTSKSYITRGERYVKGFTEARRFAKEELGAILHYSWNISGWYGNGERFEVYVRKV